jgi:hypothetical protein
MKKKVQIKVYKDMDKVIESFIKHDLILLTDFVIAKNRHASRSRIYNEINRLFQPALVGAIPKLLTSKLIIHMKQTPFGNNVLYMDGDEIFNNSRFIIDTCSKTVLGVENDAGHVEPLTKDFIEMCHKYKLAFTIPLNLNDVLEDDQTVEDEIDGLNLKYVESDNDSDSDV